jgi:outer membrane protein insertion porin family
MRRASAAIMIAGYLALCGSQATATDVGIRVAGNRHVSSDTIRSYFGAGATPGSADFDAALKALYATGLFADGQIAHRDGQVLVTVVENQRLNFRAGGF